MRFGIVVFPGSNCDHDCFYAIKEVLKQQVEYIWHKERNINRYDCLILPGGFSYGDYLRTGAIARFSPVVESVIKFSRRGGLIVGICNGFQILLEAGLLPGAMIRNSNIHFICKYSYIRTENKDTFFTNLCKQNQVLKIPIAHNDGCYYADKECLGRLKDKRLVAFRYCTKDGKIEKDANPNGSAGSIAGIVNEKGNVLGMMPHPERSMEKILGSDSGGFVFRSIIKWMEKSK